MYPVIFGVGILVGVLIGLIGIGGGVLILPVLVYYGFTIQQAVAVSLFLNTIPNALPAFWMYYREGHVHWKLALIVAAGTLVGVVAGGYIGAHGLIPRVWVSRIYSCVVIGIGVYMLLSEK